MFKPLLFHPKNTTFAPHINNLLIGNTSRIHPITMEKKKNLIIAAIVTLIVILIVLLFLLFREKKTSSDMAQLFALEIEEMESEYDRFATQYDELQVITTNDSLAQLLDKEKLRVQRLQEELRTVKATNTQEITRLKKELNTVRAVLRTYIVQIDSLNKINEALTKENKTVTRKYREATQQINSLSAERKNLSQKVELASQLDATNIRIEPRNKRNRSVKKVKDVVSFAIDFTITKNITATTGEKIIYVQIAKPDNDILTKSAANTFPFENRHLPFSIKKYIEYNGEEQEVTVYWNVEEFLHAGNYRISIFADGHIIGTQTFGLE